MKGQKIAAYGAYGHTGRFVVRELVQRGYKPVLAGRDEGRLRAVAENYQGLDVRVASVDDEDALNAAIRGAIAVVNCAGPFVDTAAPLIAAALGSKAHYLDIAAEQRAVASAFENFAESACRTDLVVAPGLAFYGGLGDLLATAAMGDWDSADEITIAIALDNWLPTRGTRLTGERNQGRRLSFVDGKLTEADMPPKRDWIFPEPFGRLEVVGLPLSETITIPHHLRIRDLHSYINVKALDDIHDPHTPTPSPADDRGRSAQMFVMEARVRKGKSERFGRASGRDIYATTAPIVVQALDLIVQGKVKAKGVISAGEAFDAREFLMALSPHDLVFESVV
jgi:hypothetical protein